MECLLDTGAKINAMNDKTFYSLNNVEIEDITETLKCANNRHLHILGKTRVDIKIWHMKQLVDFKMVKEMNPSVMGGIKLQEQFGFRLVRVKEDATKPSCIILKPNFGERRMTKRDYFGL